MVLSLPGWRLETMTAYTKRSPPFYMEAPHNLYGSTLHSHTLSQIGRRANELESISSLVGHLFMSNLYFISSLITHSCPCVCTNVKWVDMGKKCKPFMCPEYPKHPSERAWRTGERVTRAGLPWEQRCTRAGPVHRSRANPAPLFPALCSHG